MKYLYLNLVILLFYVFVYIMKKKETIVGERDESDVFVSCYKREILKIVHLYIISSEHETLYTEEKSRLNTQKDKTIGLTRAEVMVQN